jgi:hypothetical protein
VKLWVEIISILIEESLGNSAYFAYQYNILDIGAIEIRIRLNRKI